MWCTAMSRGAVCGPVRSTWCAGFAKGCVCAYVWICARACVCVNARTTTPTCAYGKAHRDLKPENLLLYDLSRTYDFVLAGTAVALVNECACVCEYVCVSVYVHFECNVLLCAVCVWTDFGFASVCNGRSLSTFCGSLVYGKKVFAALTCVPV